MKKQLLLSVTVVVVLIMVACGGGGTAGGGGAAAADDAVAQDGGNDAANGADVATHDPDSAPVVITAGRILSANPRLPEGDTQEDNAMVRWIEEQLNIDFQIVWLVDGAEFGTRLALSMAAGDLPDMIPLRAQDYLMFLSMVENEMLADLTEAYDRFAGDYMLQTFASYDFRNLEPFRVDGRLYAIGGGQFAYEHMLTWVRQDWMDELGLDAPQTLDDIANIVLAFQAAQLSGIDIEGIPISHGNPVQGYNSMHNLNAVLYSTGGAPRKWVRDENGDIIYGSLLPGMREGLQIAADWYERGIIDRQFPTRNAPGALEAMIVAEQVGLWFGPWWSPYTHPELIHSNIDAVLTAHPAPLTADGRFRHSMPAPAGDFVAMNANFPYPELVVQILNLQYDMHRGLNEEAFELWRPSLETAVDWPGAFLTQGVNLEFNDAVPVAGLFARYYVETGTWPTGQRDVTEDIIRWAESAASWANTGIVDGSNWMDYAARVVGSRVVDSPLNLPVLPVFSYATPSMADLWHHLQALEDEMYFRIILGEVGIEAFDEFVDRWWAEGGEIITAEVRSIVEGN